MICCFYNRRIARRQLCNVMLYNNIFNVSSLRQDLHLQAGLPYHTAL